MVEDAIRTVMRKGGDSLFGDLGYFKYWGILNRRAMLYDALNDDAICWVEIKHVGHGEPEYHSCTKNHGGLEARSSNEQRGPGM